MFRKVILDYLDALVSHIVPNKRSLCPTSGELWSGHPTLFISEIRWGGGAAGACSGPDNVRPSSANHTLKIAKFYTWSMIMQYKNKKEMHGKKQHFANILETPPKFHKLCFQGGSCLIKGAWDSPGPPRSSHPGYISLFSKTSPKTNTTLHCIACTARPCNVSIGDRNKVAMCVRKVCKSI